MSRSDAARLLRCFFALIIVCATIPSCTKRGAEREADTQGASHRLVVLSPAAAVMLVDLDLGGLIVGKHDYDMALPDDVPALGHQEAIDYEGLLAADPTEIIIEWGSRPLPPRLTALSETHGWSVRSVRLLTIDDIAGTLDDLAIAYGAVDRPSGNARGGTSAPGSMPIGLGYDDPSRRLAVELPSARLANAWADRGERVEGVGPVLLLASSSPPGVLGPGSFHDQILRRIGGEPAITEGAPWIELDAEDVRRLDPAAIVLIAPRAPGSQALEHTPEEILSRLGRVGTLDIAAVRSGRIALIDDPFALLPSTSMIGFADRLGALLEQWASQAP